MRQRAIERADIPVEAHLRIVDSDLDSLEEGIEKLETSLGNRIDVVGERTTKSLNRLLWAVVGAALVLAGGIVAAALNIQALS